MVLRISPKRLARFLAIGIATLMMLNVAVT